MSNTYSVDYRLRNNCIIMPEQRELFSSTLIQQVAI